MNYIEKIKLSKDEFIIENGSTPLKLPYKKDSENFIIDISSMNLISAVKTAILTSTYCFIKGFKRKILWLVKDDETKRAIGILRLKNMDSKLSTKPTKSEADNERIVKVS